MAHPAIDPSPMRRSGRGGPEKIEVSGFVNNTIPRAPAGAGPAGRRLWRAVLSEYELAEHEQTMLRQAVHVADLCETLQVTVDREGLFVAGRAHPALVELRQQRMLLARLIVALRVPLGEEEADPRPAGRGGGTARTGFQRRGMRGFYAVKGGRA